MAAPVPDWLATAVAVFGRECRTALDGPGEAEAAIRPPIERLLHTVCDALRITMTSYPETAMADLKVRPDYAIKVDRALVGYLEVKKPGLSIDPDTFTGHNRQQWERLRDLPNLLYTNGRTWTLFRDGAPLAEPVHMDGDLRTAGGRLAVADGTFEQILRDFLLWRPAPIRTTPQLVRAVAPLCRLLRHEVVDELEREAQAARAGKTVDEQLFTGLARDWRRLLFPTASDAEFADGYAQTVTFALLLARAEGVTLEGRGLHDIGDELGHGHSVMGRALQLLTDGVSQRFRVSLDLLSRVIGAVDWPRIQAANLDAYLHLYEHFLGEYDEELRRRSGSYYTPREVVSEMVRLTEEVLTARLGCERGFGSADVFTVDPAMGTGTYLHAIIQRVADRVADEEGPGAVGGAVGELAKRMAGFELQMGPFAVAELRGSDLVKKYGAALPPGGLSLHVTDTLDDPNVELEQLAVAFAPISRSRRRANQIKASRAVTVVIGNPPYRERAEGLGGWVERRPDDQRPLLDGFRLAGNGRVEYVLKNLYVYFWRWGTWKVFDAHANNDRGVVTFITTAGYLRGPGFKGMREYLRRTCTEGWIIDVSPEGMRPDVATRVFPGVQQPLAIGLFLRGDTPDRDRPAVIHYRAVHGRRENKYQMLKDISISGDGWRTVREAWHAPFTPAAESSWDDYPALGDLMPWAAPGVKANRTWVYAPSADILRRRWAQLVGTRDLQQRRELLRETRDRTMDSQVEPLPGGHQHARTLAEESGGGAQPTRVAYRTLDRQWLLADNRLIDFTRPDLWRTIGQRQVFVSELHATPFASGPGVTFAALVPDMHHFKGSEGGRVLPLRHADGSGNVAPGLLQRLAERLSVEVTADDLVAYIAGVVAHRGFTPRFAEELTTPGVRVPLTADAQLWAEAVLVGRDVVWLYTYGEAFADAASGRPNSNIRYSAGDVRQPRNTVALPARPLPGTITHDADSETLYVGSGAFAPVPTAVWEYDVGGMRVVRKWFAYRMANPGGRVSSPLDQIHAEEWPAEWTRDLNDLLTVLRRLVDLESTQDDLLDRILTGPLISVAELTERGVLPVADPARRPRREAEGGLLGLIAD